MSGAWGDADRVGFHLAECECYTADLGIWRALADDARTAASQAPATVLDIGAGTGRVALDLAARGNAVTALDIDAALLAELEVRAAAAALDVRTVTGDAEALAAALPDGPPFDLVLVPMQTAQLLPRRTALLAGVRALLARGGTAALAIVDGLAPFDVAGPGGDPPPDPDVAEYGGVHYQSQPVAVRVRPDAARIDRIRTRIAPDGSRQTLPDSVELRRLDAGELYGEAAAAGLRALPKRTVPATETHVDSEVVVLCG